MLKNLIIIVSGFILLMMAACGDKKSAEGIADDSSKLIELEVTEMLLPEENSEPRSEEVTHVVIHFSSNVVHNQENPYQIDAIYSIFEEAGVSAHYVIDRNGKMYLFVPEERVAYHAGKGNLPSFPEYKDSLNRYSIGIEFLGIGTKEEMMEYLPEEVYEELDPEWIGYTEAQYVTLNELLSYIDKRYPEVQMNRSHVIGHDEYAPERKVDPGELFEWGRVEVLE